jgi:hypothetical protein
LRISLYSSLLAGNLGGDRFAMDCVLSHPVASLYRTSAGRKYSRYFGGLASKNRSLSCGICSDYAFVGDILGAVSHRKFSISEMTSRRHGSQLAETSSYVCYRAGPGHFRHPFAMSVNDSCLARRSKPISAYRTPSDRPRRLCGWHPALLVLVCRDPSPPAGSRTSADRPST